MYTPHSWESPEGRLQTAQDWLNQTDGLTCTKCGVTYRQNSKNLSMPSNQHTYTDAVGRTWTSRVPIGCPAFLGDVGGTAMTTHQQVKGLTSDVKDLSVTSEELRMDVVDHESRLVSVEAEQARLREQLEATQRGVGALIAWMGELVSAHRALGLPTRRVDVGGETALLPEPLVDLILDLGRVERDGVPVYAIPDEESSE